MGNSSKKGYRYYKNDVNVNALLSKYVTIFSTEYVYRILTFEQYFANIGKKCLSSCGSKCYLAITSSQ